MSLADYYNGADYDAKTLYAVEKALLKSKDTPVLLKAAYKMLWEGSPDLANRYNLVLGESDYHGQYRFYCNVANPFNKSWNVWNLDSYINVMTCLKRQIQVSKEVIASMKTVREALDMMLPQ